MLLSNMRIGLLTSILILSVSLSLQAQPNVEQLNHDLKVYINKDTESLFWPKDKPVFVKLSSSPDPQAPSYLLQNMYVQSEGNTEISPDHHIELELSGNQYMRWFNAATQDTFLLWFQADGFPPESEISLRNADQFQQGDTTYYGQGLVAELSASDQHSGVNNIYISIDGSDYSRYSSSLQFNQEKKVDILLYAVDNVGNVERPKYRTFVIDLTPPSTRHEISGAYRGSVLAPEATIALNSNDDLSGVSEIYYRFNDEPEYRVYENSLSIQDFEDGNHSLYYYAQDNVGNKENPSTFSFTFDSASPVVEIQVDGDQHERNSVSFISSRTRFVLNAEDTKSGVQSISYGVDGANMQQYMEDFSLPSKEGNRTIVYSALDNLNNQSQQIEAIFFMDVTPPVSSYELDGPNYNQRDTYWITKDTEIKLEASDENSGVKDIQYSLSGSEPNNYYSEPLLINNEGRHQLTFRSTDNVNNIEEINSLTLVVDNMPPDIIVNFNTPKIGSSTGEDDLVLDIFPTGTTIFLAATDESSGASSIRYRINESESFQEYQEPISFEPEGEYKLFIIATDRVGNTSEQVIHFLISE